MALTEDAFTYWENLKSNTEELGSLFGPQPVELTGNLHCLNKPGLPVLGYISATNVQQKRIFINNLQLKDWGYYTYCQDSLVLLSSYYPGWYNRDFVPIEIVMVSHLLIAYAYCADCTLAGPGNNMKPAFWP